MLKTTFEMKVKSILLLFIQPAINKVKHILAHYVLKTEILDLIGRYVTDTAITVCRRTYLICKLLYAGLKISIEKNCDT